MLRLTGTHDKTVPAHRFMLALSCASCLLIGGAAIAAETPVGPKPFDPTSFKAGLNARMAAVPRPSGSVSGGASPRSPQGGTNGPVSGYRPTGSVANAFGTVPTNMTGSPVRPISGPMSGYRPTGTVGAPAGFNSGRTLRP